MQKNLIKYNLSLIANWAWAITKDCTKAILVWNPIIILFSKAKVFLKNPIFMNLVGETLHEPSFSHVQNSSSFISMSFVSFESWRWFSRTNHKCISGGKGPRGGGGLSGFGVPPFLATLKTFDLYDPLNVKIGSF